MAGSLLFVVGIAMISLPNFYFSYENTFLGLINAGTVFLLIGALGAFMKNFATEELPV
jgi:hypothetical protein